MNRGRVMGMAWLALLLVLSAVRCPRQDASVASFMAAFQLLPSGGSVVVVHPPWRTDVVAALQPLSSRRIGRTLNPTAGAAWPEVVVLADANQPVPSTWSTTMRKVASTDGIDRWERR
jgi:hypothetical protein